MHDVNVKPLFMEELNDILNYISQHFKALGMYTFTDFGFHGFISPSLGVLPTKASNTAIAKTRLHMIIFLLRTILQLPRVINRTLKE